MRVEKQGEFHILCGVILPASCIKVGQRWISVGSRVPVEVTKVEQYAVHYQSPVQRPHAKEQFAFQCRYCLVLDGPSIPKEILAAVNKPKTKPVAEVN